MAELLPKVSRIRRGRANDCHGGSQPDIEDGSQCLKKRPKLVWTVTEGLYNLVKRPLNFLNGIFAHSFGGESHAEARGSRTGVFGPGRHLNVYPDPRENMQPNFVGSGAFGGDFSTRELGNHQVHLTKCDDTNGGFGVTRNFSNSDDNERSPSIPHSFSLDRHSPRTGLLSMSASRDEASSHLDVSIDGVFSNPPSEDERRKTTCGIGVSSNLPVVSSSPPVLAEFSSGHLGSESKVVSGLRDGESPAGKRLGSFSSSGGGGRTATPFRRFWPSPRLRRFLREGESPGDGKLNFRKDDRSGEARGEKSELRFNISPYSTLLECASLVYSSRIKRIRRVSLGGSDEDLDVVIPRAPEEKRHTESDLATRSQECNHYIPVEGTTFIKRKKMVDLGVLNDDKDNLNERPSRVESDRMAIKARSFEFKRNDKLIKDKSNVSLGDDDDIASEFSSSFEVDLDQNFGSLDRRRDANDRLDYLSVDERHVSSANVGDGGNLETETLATTETESAIGSVKSTDERVGPFRAFGSDSLFFDRPSVEGEKKDFGDTLLNVKVERGPKVDGADSSEVVEVEDPDRSGALPVGVDTRGRFGSPMDSSMTFTNIVPNVAVNESLKANDNIISDVVTANESLTDDNIMSDVVTMNESLKANDNIMSDVVTTNESLKTNDNIMSDVVTANESLKVDDKVATSKDLGVEDMSKAIVTNKSLNVNDNMTNRAIVGESLNVDDNMTNRNIVTNKSLNVNDNMANRTIVGESPLEVRRGTTNSEISQFLPFVGDEVMEKSARGEEGDIAAEFGLGDRTKETAKSNRDFGGNNVSDWAMTVTTKVCSDKNENDSVDTGISLNSSMVCEKSAAIDTKMPSNSIGNDVSAKSLDLINTMKNRAPLKFAPTNGDDVYDSSIKLSNEPTTKESSKRTLNESTTKESSKRTLNESTTTESSKRTLNESTTTESSNVGAGSIFGAFKSTGNESAGIFGANSGFKNSFAMVGQVDAKSSELSNTPSITVDAIKEGETKTCTSTGATTAPNSTFGGLFSFNLPSKVADTKNVPNITGTASPFFTSKSDTKNIGAQGQLDTRNIGAQGSFSSTNADRTDAKTKDTFETLGTSGGDKVPAFNVFSNNSPGLNPKKPFAVSSGVDSGAMGHFGASNKGAGSSFSLFNTNSSSKQNAGTAGGLFATPKFDGTGNSTASTPSFGIDGKTQDAASNGGSFSLFNMLNSSSKQNMGTAGGLFGTPKFGGIGNSTASTTGFDTHKNGEKELPLASGNNFNDQFGSKFGQLNTWSQKQPQFSESNSTLSSGQKALNTSANNNFGNFGLLKNKPFDSGNQANLLPASGVNPGFSSTPGFGSGSMFNNNATNTNNFGLNSMAWGQSSSSVSSFATTPFKFPTTTNNNAGNQSNDVNSGNRLFSNSSSTNNVNSLNNLGYNFSIPTNTPKPKYGSNRMKR